MQSRERSGTTAPKVWAVLLIAGALLVAVRTTADLSWPPRWDFFRDLGSAQSVLDGQVGTDPLFLRETAWYNPLIPVVVAGASRWFDLPLPTFVVRAGPFLNLFVPIGFFLLFRRFFGDRAAALGLAIFLFWPAPNLPAGSSGTYSPWAWPRNIGQAFYFAGAIGMLGAFERSRGWAVVAGVLLGLCFLAHTAPALMLVLTALLFAANSIRLSPTRVELRRQIGIVAIIGIGALVIALCYLWPLWEAYHLHVRNRAPMNYVGLSVWRMAFGLVSFRFALACYGVLTLVRLRPDGGTSTRIRFLSALCLACVVFLGWGCVFQLAKGLGIELIQVVPEYHFHMYFKTFEAAFAGLGAAALVELVWPRLVGGLRRPASMSLGYLCAGVAVVVLNAPAYLQGEDHRLYREESLARAGRTPMNEFYAWALRHTRSDDVFLCDNPFGLFGVGPAGRKVVSTYAFYSNPYVPFEARETRRLELFAALNAGRMSDFVRLAEREALRYVVVTGQAEPCCQVVAPMPARWFDLAFENGPVRVYRLRLSAETVD